MSEKTDDLIEQYNLPPGIDEKLGVLTPDQRSQLAKELDALLHEIEIDARSATGQETAGAIAARVNGSIIIMNLHERYVPHLMFFVEFVQADAAKTMTAHAEIKPNGDGRA